MARTTPMHHQGMTAYWTEFFLEHSLSKREASFSSGPADDPWEHQIRFLSDDEIDRERDVLPGSALENLGYVAVADDTCPSGDLYYINSNEGIGGALYKIFHDSVSESGCEQDEAVYLVLHDYRKLARFLSTPSSSNSCR